MSGRLRASYNHKCARRLMITKSRNHEKKRKVRMMTFTGRIYVHCPIHSIQMDKINGSSSDILKDTSALSDMNE